MSANHASRGLATFARSAVTSIFTTAVDFGVLIGLVEIFHVHPVLATWCGTIVGCLSNFSINRSWAFASGGVAHWQLVRFLPVQAGSSAIQTGGVAAFIGFAGLPYLTAKCIVAVVVYLGWNYPLNRYFVFPAPALAVSREGPGETRQRAA